jgi:hypothetical protein
VYLEGREWLNPLWRCKMEIPDTFHDTADLVVCATCRRPLDRVVRVSTASVPTVTWVHPRVGLADHAPVPVLADMTGGAVVGVCDFCSNATPCWSYPCHSFTIGAYGSNGPWAACTNCAALIEAGDATALARRTSTGNTGLICRHTLTAIAQLHAAFFKHRLVDRRPL